MQIKRKSNRKKNLIALSSVVIVVAIGAASYATYHELSKNTNNKTQSINYNPPTSEQKATGEQTKKNSVNPNDSSNPNTSGSDQAASPTSGSNGKSVVSAVMTSANQNNSLLQLRFSLGTVTNAGTCTLTLKKDGSTVTKTAGVQALAGNSTCEGFDVATTELSPGNWSVTMSFENDSLTGQTSGTATVR